MFINFGKKRKKYQIFFTLYKHNMAIIYSDSFIIKFKFKLNK